jgi:RHS repeat-associated protein
VGSNPADVYDVAYDAADQATSATLKTTDPTPSILKRYAYAYDAVGNRTAEQIDDAVMGATLNTRNQVTSLQPGGALLFRGTLNEAATVTVQAKPAQVTTDNRFEGPAQVTSGTNTVTVTATDPSGNLRTNTYQLSVSGTGKTLAYDANGNLTGDGSRTFEWDAENRLVAINQGTRRSEFTYDGRGHRTRILDKDGATVLADRRLVWCEAELCEERDAAGQVVKRFSDHGFQQGGVSYFYLRDHLGSIRQVTDGTSAVRARYDYDGFGRRTKLSGDVDADFGFTGHLFHTASGLHLSQYRAYDADLGRWLSEDPLGPKAGTNLYEYVGGNPFTLTDPAGLAAYLRCEELPSTRGGGLVGAAIVTLAKPRHCYIDIICPDKWRVTIELYGPNGPQCGSPRGCAFMNLPSATRNANSSVSPIYPPGCGGNPSTYDPCPSGDCRFEEELINQFNQQQPPPIYNPQGPNSNTFAARIISGAGGRTTFPPTAYGSCP